MLEAATAGIISGLLQKPHDSKFIPTCHPGANTESAIYGRNGAQTATGLRCHSRYLEEGAYRYVVASQAINQK